MESAASPQGPMTSGLRRLLMRYLGPPVIRGQQRHQNL